MAKTVVNCPHCGFQFETAQEGKAFSVTCIRCDSLFTVVKTKRGVDVKGFVSPRTQTKPGKQGARRKDN